jgi:hypothetical protein
MAAARQQLPEGMLESSNIWIEDRTSASKLLVNGAPGGILNPQLSDRSRTSPRIRKRQEVRETRNVCYFAAIATGLILLSNIFSAVLGLIPATIRRHLHLTDDETGDIDSPLSFLSQILTPKKSHTTRVQYDIRKASMLVIPTPESPEARRMAKITRAVNPRIEIVARTHSEEEAALLEKRFLTKCLWASTSSPLLRRAPCPSDTSLGAIMTTDCMQCL